MTIYAKFKGTEVCFLPENIFREKKQIIINHPMNADDCNDKIIPAKIPLAELTMDQKQKNEIIAQMERARNKKQNSKDKRRNKKRKV